LPSQHRVPVYPMQHLPWDSAHPCHVCTGTGFPPRHICAETGLIPATSALGLGHSHHVWFTPVASLPGPGFSLPHRHQDSAHPYPHLRRDWAHPGHICNGTARISAHLRGGWVHPCPLKHSHPHLPTPTAMCTAKLGGLGLAASAPGLGASVSHLHKDLAHPSNILAGTGHIPATSAGGWAHTCHISTGSRLTPATSAPGLGLFVPHLRRDWAHPYPHLPQNLSQPCRICTGTGFPSAPGLVSTLSARCAQDRVRPCHSAPALGTSLPDVQKDWAHNCHICAGTAKDRCPLAPSAGIVPYIFAGTAHIPTRSTPGLSTSLPHLLRDRVHPSHTCTGTGHIPVTSARD
jgi:hypothetical protein